MHRRYFSVAFLAANFCQLGNAAESFFENIAWVPSAAVHMQNLQFDQRLFKGSSSLPASASGDLEVNLPVLALGLTAFYERYYVAIEREDSVDDALTSTTVPFTGGKSSVGLEDLSLTFGMRLSDGLRGYVGYRDAETVIKNITGFPSPPQTPRYEQNYQEDGIVLGARYDMPVLELGTLSFDASYAILDGVYEDNFATAGRNFEYDGDSEGFKIGARWSALLTKRIAYHLDLRYQRYEFDGNDANGNFAGAEVEIDQQVLSYGAGLEWLF
ncbi:MAG TPA: hypothetical protein DIW43_13615 [Spongiibacteraceae bacterium]|mgnify:CR=1 FL=1|nr:hypothetical protein [Spongiibacteraceae bacterium]HCS28492.1 hypothetical protein [Spongiibacteraceae bacterium]|tara:strand:+ start:834 stop:1646 length:813 start_codon:yes stop_codon:yes gene_type:complete